jgi:adenine-specific DNA glycosylase
VQWRRRKAIQELLPQKGEKPELPLKRGAAFVRCATIRSLLLVKRPEKGLLGALWAAVTRSGRGRDLSFSRGGEPASALQGEIGASASASFSPTASRILILEIEV